MKTYIWGKEFKKNKGKGGKYMLKRVFNSYKDKCIIYIPVDRLKRRLNSYVTVALGANFTINWRRWERSKCIIHSPVDRLKTLLNGVKTLL